MCCSRLEHKIASSPLSFSLLSPCLYPPFDKLYAYQLVTIILLRFVSVFGKEKHLKDTVIPSVPNRAERPIVIPTHKARMDKITFPFLSLPPELQTEAVNYISNYSDLKALCLASKHLSGIATPRLYYELDLRTGVKSHASRMRQRINSLLLQPANLLFVRIIKTPTLGRKESQLMGRLLPLLRQDSLTKFRFSATSEKSFPTPMQMKFIWNHQKKLQNQKLYWHMVPALEEILEERTPSEVALLKSFTVLDIDVNNYRTHRSVNSIRDSIGRPLKFLDLSFMQKLRVCGDFCGCVVLPLLNTLFAHGSFINLKELTLSDLIFEEKLILTNLPALKSLALQEDRNGILPMPVVLPDNIRLSSFFGWSFWDLEEITPLLARIKDLESLHIKCEDEIMSTDEPQQEFIHAMISYQDTLCVLNLELRLSFISQLHILSWELDIMEAIKCCKKLVTLSLPLSSNRSIRELIASLPDLVTLTIYDSFICRNWSQDYVNTLFWTSIHLKVIYFKGLLPNCYEEWEQRFERK